MGVPGVHAGGFGYVLRGSWVWASARLCPGVHAERGHRGATTDTGLIVSASGDLMSDSTGSTFGGLWLFPTTRR